ncbi:CAP domain-containing protein [Streptomyces sp. NPDC004561]
MGRHRRSTADRAATGNDTGSTPTYRSATGGHDPRYPAAGRQTPMGIAPYLNPEAYAEANARAQAYLFAADDRRGAPGGGFTPDDGPSHGRRRRKKPPKPVRTGLLGVSAAVALGTAAVATGVVPGLQNYRFGGGTHTTGGDQVQAGGLPSNTATAQGGTSGSADARTGDGGTSRDTERTASPAGPSASPSTSDAASPTPAPSKTAAAQQHAGPKTTPPAPRTTPSTAKPSPSRRTATEAPSASSAPVTTSPRAAVEAEVLKLVNQERAKVGCSALTASPSLTKLAETFSDDMAARDFFDHTDPDGRTPWDRAAAAGITNLGGENIARGQADAAAVMDAWMNSPGHRANILNCDFKTLGVGAHLGPGGPWWTQDFGY